MENQNRLFVDILKNLSEKNALDELVLIGSWCLPIYKAKYQGLLDDLPQVRTSDLDFFINKPKRVNSVIDIPDILKKLDFIIEFDSIDGFEKFSHPLLEVEFLSPMDRTGESIGSCKNLKVKTQALRYLDSIESNSISIAFSGVEVRVPSLPFFVLHKALIQPMRKNQLKSLKDAQTVTKLGEIISGDDGMRGEVKKVFESFPKKWQRRISDMLKDHCSELLEVISN